MSGNVPKDIREQIQDRIWSKADDLQWRKLPDIERVMWYENWAKDDDVGGILAHFMDPRRVRVYIKDSLLKPYQRARLEDGLERVLAALDLESGKTMATTVFYKPHGRLLLDGRVICWGNSRDWKIVLFAVFERACHDAGREPYAAVLMETGQSTRESTRELIKEAGRRLGIAKVIWLE